MAEIILESNQKEVATALIREAIDIETKRLKYSLSLAQSSLKKFEKKYNIPSEKFIMEWAAEDLEGKDLEYVEWAGEYKLASRLIERLDTITSIKYVS